MSSNEADHVSDSGISEIEMPETPTEPMRTVSRELPVVPDKYRTHTEGKKFVNKWNPSETPIMMDYLKSVLPYRLTHRKPEPGPAVQSRTLNFSHDLHNRKYEDEKIEPAAFFFNESISAVWLGHSSVLFQLHGVTFLVDPVRNHRLGRGPFFRQVRRAGHAVYSWEALPRVDVVLLTHAHAGHFEAKTIKSLESTYHPTFVCPDGMGPMIAKCGADATRIHSLRLWKVYSARLTEPQQVDIDITLVPTQSYHDAGCCKENAVLWGGFHVRATRAAITHSSLVIGPSGYDPEWAATLGKLGPVDLAFIGIGGSEPGFLTQHHMTPFDAVALHRQIASEFTVGTHWGTYHQPGAWETLLEPALTLADAVAEAPAAAPIITTVIGETIFPQRGPEHKQLNVLTSATVAAVRDIIANDLTMPNLLATGGPADRGQTARVLHKIAFQRTTELVGVLEAAKDESGGAYRVDVDAVQALVLLAAAAARHVVDTQVADNIGQTTRGDALQAILDIEPLRLGAMVRETLLALTSDAIMDIPDRFQLYWPRSDDATRRLTIGLESDPLAAVVRALNTDRGQAALPTGSVVFLSPSALEPVLHDLVDDADTNDPRFLWAGIVMRGLQSMQVGDEVLDVPVVWMCKAPSPTRAEYVPPGIEPVDFFAGTPTGTTRRGPDLHSLPLLLLHQHSASPQARAACRAPHVPLTEQECGKLLGFALQTREEMVSSFAYTTDLVDTFPQAAFLRSFRLLAPLLPPIHPEDAYSGTLVGRTFQHLGLLDPTIPEDELHVDTFSYRNARPSAPHGPARHGLASYVPLLEPTEVEIVLEVAG